VESLLRFERRENAFALAFLESPDKAAGKLKCYRIDSIGW
jgi:hypothetical protein